MSSYNIGMKKGNALSLISRIRAEANRFIVRELANHGIKGIVPSHGDILMVLFQGEKCTMKELANRIYRTKSTVTVLIEKLVEYGFVEKEKSSIDCRATYIRLTDQGIALKPVFADISKKLDALFYGHLTSKEAEIFEEILRRVIEKLDNKKDIYTLNQ
ncbi:MAG: MarR family winged helix-turn-helix transcriptional regulator [Desulfotomaculaceae bacterium]|nr:MarR family winged helix-turn-helix transcriptional regulator [Desulfotomaculaceae bacterium]